MKHLSGFFAALRCAQNDKSYLIQQRQVLKPRQSNLNIQRVSNLETRSSNLLTCCFNSTTKVASRSNI